jgi:hypothetical protein
MSDIKLGIVFDVKNDRFKSEVKQNTQSIKPFGNSYAKAAERICKIDYPKIQIRPPKYSDNVVNDTKFYNTLKRFLHV